MVEGRELQELFLVVPTIPVQHDQALEVREDDGSATATAAAVIPEGGTE